MRICSIMFTAWLLATTSLVSLGAGEQPRLVLQITVDQLRGDLLHRYADRFGEGGFKYLMDQGTYYLNAHHRHANTETIVGHTTLATGADPAAHGMIGNVWLDRSTGELSYNVEDARYPLLTKGADVDKATEIDPTQRAARSEGRSPSAILTSTFGDELKLFTGGKAKIFGVSVKDRGAISMAGHTGKAFWFSKKSGEFVSSKFYYDAYPEWVSKWNETKPTSKYVNKAWTLLNDRSTYMFGEADDRPYESSLLLFGRTFPHRFGDGSSKLFTTFLTASPPGDELVAEFAKELIDNESIGADSTPDYLSVSFSSTDYVGHLFGPSSLESEDNLLQLDRTLAKFLKDVDEKIGLDKTLIVLSADHGAPEAPGYLRELGFDSAYVNPSEFDKEKSIGVLKKKFGIGEELITKFFQPYLYLNRERIREKGLDQGEVERAVAEEVEKFDGVALAISSTALSEGDFADIPLIRSVLRNFNPKRSGDVYVVFEPNRFINDFGSLKVTSTHGSPWRYDTFVPIIFAGKGVEAKRIGRRVETVDVAPTLSLLIGAKPPSGSVGEPLVELTQ